MERRFPAEDEERLWSLLEAAWAPLGGEVGQARWALANQMAGDDLSGPTPFTVVEAALDDFLSNLRFISGKLPSDELTRLDRVVEAKLYDLDRADLHGVVGGSDDGFLYARGFVVALGRDFYAAVADDPKAAVPDAECAEMCYFFAHLHHRRHGDFPDTGSGISRESCSNAAGWRDS
ncbi:DUF4240 domain-containing protein [Nonomuraea rhodomycinica]|uniref:DUF4240 domain-containing protein n=1 Tax=Nonomuraea rhodomycinica TaxID=1712872 RepID=A0A7Y6IVV6_9ACTN|nr:DUF4240 domain-containing protein [Nonomuraea rhodomycinica]NUW45028.1 DUF4240 domain-containing protein [Nonomuraea rhodomycinica]